MFAGNRVTELLGIRYPIIQAGMVWCSGWKLAVGASKEGILGVLGAGSMDLSTLEYHIDRCIEVLEKDKLPYAVNLPLIYHGIDNQIQLIIEKKVPIVITSAGNPATYTQKLKSENIKVIHVVSGTKFAIKAQNSGVDAVIAEGFEAGGHNGREETTTMCLIPSVCAAVKIPVIAAGGIACGKSMLAARILGADGVQIGTRFAASIESSAHINFKNTIINAVEGDTILTMKKKIPVRMYKNEMCHRILDAENQGASREELIEILGTGKSRAGIFEGNLSEGELEMGQVSAGISELLSVKQIVKSILDEYYRCSSNFCKNSTGNTLP